MVHFENSVWQVVTNLAGRSERMKEEKLHFLIIVIGIGNESKSSDILLL